MNIYDELNYEFDAYKVLGISKESNDATIKDAYKLKKIGSSPEEIKILDISYTLIKDSAKRARYNLIRVRPLDSLDEIKSYGFKPQKTETRDWFKLIIDCQPKS